VKVQNRRSDSVPSPRFARERGTEYDSWWDNHGPMVRSYISAQSWKFLEIHTAGGITLKFAPRTARTSAGTKPIAFVPKCAYVSCTEKP